MMEMIEERILEGWSPEQIAGGMFQDSCRLDRLVTLHHWVSQNYASLSSHEIQWCPFFPNF
jgi:hypothetical protein